MLKNQIYLFAIFLANGILIGLFFDFFRILRKVFKTTNFITYIEDIIFWLISGSLFLFNAFYFNNGQIRMFMILGIGIGLIFYILTVSKFIIKINVKILGFFKKIIYKILRIVFMKPITFIFINIRKITSLFSNKM